MIYVMIWCLVWGCLCALIGKDKNREPFAWFIVGAILGFIGLLIVLFVDDKSKVFRLLHRRVRCRECGESIAKQAKVCRFCNASVKPGSLAAEFERQAKS